MSRALRHETWVSIIIYRGDVSFIFRNIVLQFFTFLAKFEQHVVEHFLSCNCRSSSWLLAADSLYACCSDGCVVSGGAEHTDTWGVSGARGLSGVGGPFGLSRLPSLPPRSVSTSSLVIITDGVGPRFGLKIVGKSPSLAMALLLPLITHNDPFVVPQQVYCWTEQTSLIASLITRSR